MTPRLFAMIIVLGPAIVLFVESIAFFIYPLRISEFILQTTYPQLGTLSEYCNNLNCLYDPISVATTYSIQLITFITICAIFYFLGQKNKDLLNSSVVSVCGIVVLGALMDYVIGNFTFRRIWVAPNSVATSPLGVFRYALLFSIASICAAILTNVVKKGQGDANS